MQDFLTAIILIQFFMLCYLIYKLVKEDQDEELDHDEYWDEQTAKRLLSENQLSIDDLPGDIKIMALRNVNEQRPYQYSPTSVDGPLETSFDWHGSNEGFTFWWLCSKTLFDEARQRLSAKKATKEREEGSSSKDALEGISKAIELGVKVIESLFPDSTEKAPELIEEQEEEKAPIFYKDLPRDIKARALRNFKLKDFTLEIADRFRANDIEMSEAFIWEDTPEGFAYWALVDLGEFDTAEKVLEKRNKKVSDTENATELLTDKK